MHKAYKNVILGGTFDHLHAGHRHLLEAAFEHATHVTIGLSIPEMYQKKGLSEVIESYEIRETGLQNYMHDNGYEDRGEIIRLTDIYGESLVKADIDAIFVTDLTYPNALIINQEREKSGFPALIIEKVAFVKGSDGKVITSERIRYGEIDREGNPYKELFASDLVLPTQLREALQQPIGSILPDASLLEFSRHQMVITVGDVVTARLKDAGYTPAVSIIDLKTRRHAVEHSSLDLAEARHVKNQASTIDSEAALEIGKALQDWLLHKNPKIIVVDGEEDLLSLPTILLAPLGSVVLYGQYEMGIVVNEVTEEMKEKVVGLVKKFEN